MGWGLAHEPHLCQFIENAFIYSKQTWLLPWNWIIIKEVTSQSAEDQTLTKVEFQRFVKSGVFSALSLFQLTHMDTNLSFT